MLKKLIYVFVVLGFLVAFVVAVFEFGLENGVRERSRVFETRSKLLALGVRILDRIEAGGHQSLSQLTAQLDEHSDFRVVAVADASVDVKELIVLYDTPQPASEDLYLAYILSSNGNSYDILFMRPNLEIAEFRIEKIAFLTWLKSITDDSANAPKQVEELFSIRIKQ